jgi:hypothetical protein
LHTYRDSDQVWFIPETGEVFLDFQCVGSCGVVVA